MFLIRLVYVSEVSEEFTPDDIEVHFIYRQETQRSEGRNRITVFQPQSTFCNAWKALVHTSTKSITKFSMTSAISASLCLITKRLTPENSINGPWDTCRNPA